MDIDELAFGDCPTCGLPSQLLEGGPQGFPFHDCEWVLALKSKAAGASKDTDPVTQLLGAVANGVSNRAHAMPGRDLGDVLQGAAAILKAQGAGAGGSGQELLDFLRAPVDESDPLEAHRERAEQAKGQAPEAAPVVKEEPERAPPKRRSRRTPGDDGPKARKALPWPGARGGRRSKGDEPG